MRLLRIIGTLLMLAAAFTLLLWFLSTLLPIQQASRLQPLTALEMEATAPGQKVLLECRVDREINPTRSSMPLNCSGVTVQARNVPYLSSSLLSSLDTTAIRHGKPIGVSDPVVAIGKLFYGNDTALDADVVAYGSRETYLAALRENSLVLLMAGYGVTAVGLTTLLVDWQLAKRSQRQKTQKAQRAMREMLELMGRK